MTKPDQIYTAEVLGKSLSSTKDVLRNEEIQPTNLENGQLDGSDISKNSLDPTAPMQGAQLPSQTGKNGMALFSNGTSAYWAEILSYLLQLSKSIDDLHYTGSTINLVAGETLLTGQLVYVKSDGKAWLTEPNAIATMPAIGICVTSSVSANGTATILTYGTYRNDAFNWTTGNILYAKRSADNANVKGGLTATAPNTGDSVTQPVAIALSADIIFLNPQLTLVTHTS